MTAPLVVLAIGAALIGFGIEYNGTLEKFLAETPQVAYVGRVAASEPSPGSLASLHQSIALQSTVLVIVGILFTGLLYRFQTRRLVNGLTEAMKVVGAYQISAGKFFFDPLYNFFVVWPLELFATACAWFDNGFIDGAVNSIGRLPKWFGASLRPLQGGLIQFYALAMIFGILIFLGVLLL
jgi:NADH-quinone oxidoreductase subunit L